MSGLIAVDGHRLVSEPFTSGATYIGSLLKQWNKDQAQDVVVLLPFEPGPTNRWVDVLASYRERLLVANAPDPARSLKRQWLWQQVHIPRLVRRSDAAVYFSPFHLTPLPTSVRTVTTIHDLCFNDDPSFVGRWSHKLELLTARRSHTWIAVSETTRSSIVRSTALGSRTVLVPNGIDDSTLTREAAEALLSRFALPQEFLLWVGNLNPRKRPDLVFSVAEHLGIHLVVVVPDRQSEVARRAAGANSTVVSDLGSDEVRALYRTALVALLPSTCEGFGYPALESMRQGTPPVGLAGGAVDELTGPLVSHASVADPSSYGEAVSTAMDDIDHQALITRSLQFTGVNMARQTLEVLRSSRKKENRISQGGK